MIRYKMDIAELRRNIQATRKTWLRRAKKWTEIFTETHSFDKKAAIWSEIKPVYMLLQNNKCVFCEKQLEGGEYGTIEFDLEHFRPKSSVRAWPVPGLHRYQYEFATGTDHPTGYYWLALDLANYAASCKVCNSNLKSNYFPIAGTRCTSPGDLAAEQPFLCYPLGDADDDPEDLVTFIATTAVPAAASGHRRRRGQVIIDFFDLNVREHLHRERARMIMMIGPSLTAMTAGTDSAAHRAVVARLVSGRFPHTACLRAFVRAWDRDPAFGRATLDACVAYYLSEAGTPVP